MPEFSDPQCRFGVKVYARQTLKKLRFGQVFGMMQNEIWFLKIHQGQKEVSH